MFEVCRTNLIIQLRPLVSDDLPQLKKLCAEWFPIKYPEKWYTDVTSGKHFLALCACLGDGELVGVIITELRDYRHCNKEDQDILGTWTASKMAYILILGTCREHRRKGVAAFMLSNLLTRVQQHQQCHAVYLHVLATNASAVLFYEHQQFRRHKRLPNYYLINGQRMDGYSYVRYINNGTPPWTMQDLVDKMFDYLSRFACCRVTRYLFTSFKIICRQPSHNNRILNL